jgi:hypothetical protein
MGIMAHPVTGNTGSPSLKSLSNMLTPLVFTRTRFRAVAILVVQQNVSNRRSVWLSFSAGFQPGISAQHFRPGFQPSISAPDFSPAFPLRISAQYFSQTFQSL